MPISFSPPQRSSAASVAVLTHLDGFLPHPSATGRVQPTGASLAHSGSGQSGYYRSKPQEGQKLVDKQPSFSPNGKSLWDMFCIWQNSAPVVHSNPLTNQSFIDFPLFQPHLITLHTCLLGSPPIEAPQNLLFRHMLQELALERDTHTTPHPPAPGWDSGLGSLASQMARRSNCWW